MCVCRDCVRSRYVDINDREGEAEAGQCLRVFLLGTESDDGV